MQQLKTAVIIGVGLIGGSFALAIKRAGLVEHIIGVGRSSANLQRALELSVIDEISDDAAIACANADLVLVATPVGQMAKVFATIAPHLPKTAIVTDGGSTKGDVLALMQQYLPNHLANCVPAHPIAGSDLSGASAAQYVLYQNRKVVLTPLPQTSSSALETVSELWRACGASIHLMPADQHDSMLASVSHLPHLLAFAYVEMIAGKTDAERCFDFAATGFRDFTRIAGSNAEMWRDICLANREALAIELNNYRQALAVLAEQLTNGDGLALNNAFERAHEARVAWSSSRQT